MVKKSIKGETKDIGDLKQVDKQNNKQDQPTQNVDGDQSDNENNDDNESANSASTVDTEDIESEEMSEWISLFDQIILSRPSFEHVVPIRRKLDKIQIDFGDLMEMVVLKFDDERQSIDAIRSIHRLLNAERIVSRIPNVVGGTEGEF